MMQENNSVYIVEEVIRETENVVTLKLSCKDGLPSYIPGQFITVFFPETNHLEGKSYSISSAPHEKNMSITVKGVGVFSNALSAKKVGDTITASPPYGYFYSESETSSLVIVTGGIGIAPFRSMIVNSLYKNRERKIILLYANKTKSSIIFRKEFDELEKKFPESFKVVYYITQEIDVDGAVHGRIAVTDIVKESVAITESEIFLCGSIAFVRDYWRDLKASGVSEEKIYTEAFF
jgi:ferredoxin-NADP reductase